MAETASVMAEVDYYNLLPAAPKAQRSVCSPTSSSEDSGVPQDERAAPERPPRACDDEGLVARHAYCNLPALQPTTPPLPRRQPLLARPRTPPLLQRSLQPHISASRCSSVSSYKSSSVVSTSGHCQPFRKRFQTQRKPSSSVCKCKNARDSSSGADDVILMYSRHCSGSVEWAKYLHKLYTELSKHKSTLSVKHLPLEDVADCVMPSVMEAQIYQSRLQLVLLSPIFLQFLLSNPSAIVGRLLNPDRVIAIMLGVHDHLIRAEHRAGLVSFSQWIHLEAKDHDLEFVQTVLYFSTQILHKVAPSYANKSGSRAAINQQTNRSGRLESNFFNVHPRKVTESQNRVVVVFDGPQDPRCQIKVTLDRRQTGLQDVVLEQCSFKNPYNLQVSIPNCCFSVSYLAGIRIEIDGVAKGCRTIKVESLLSELDHLLRITHDPIELMCQASGIHSACKDQLDQQLAKQFLRHVPKGFHLLKNASVAVLDRSIQKDLSEFPTLLHFAAGHGLLKLTSCLLDCPGAREACLIKNSSDLTAADLAQMNGHMDTVKQIRQFEMSIYYNNNCDPSDYHVYDYIFSPRNMNSGSVEASPQPKAKPAASYQVPPPPRPVPLGPSNGRNPGSSPAKMRHDTPIRRPKKSIDRPVVNRFGTLRSEKRPETTTNDPFGTMRASRRLAATDRPELPIREPCGVDDVEDDDEVFVAHPFGTQRSSIKSSSRPPPQIDYRSLPRSGNASATKTTTNAHSTADANLATDLAITDELLHILDDLKKKTYSRKEMEILFENWRRKAAVVMKNSDQPSERTCKVGTKEELEHLKDKLKGHKAFGVFMKLFKSGPAFHSGLTGCGDTLIVPGKDTKTFRRPPASNPEQPLPQSEAPWCGPEELPSPALDEVNMSVIALPPTPDKNSKNKLDGVSSQILPLSRLSTSPPTSEAAYATPKVPNNTLSSLRPVPDSGGADEDESTYGGVREKLDKVKRSLAEPLLQYFHDLQSSPDLQEPEVLNTPRSLLPPEDSVSRKVSRTKSRSLFVESGGQSSKAAGAAPVTMVTHM